MHRRTRMMLCSGVVPHKHAASYSRGRWPSAAKPEEEQVAPAVQAAPTPEPSPGSALVCMPTFVGLPSPPFHGPYLIGLLEQYKRRQRAQAALFATSPGFTAVFGNIDVSAILDEKCQAYDAAAAAEVDTQP